MKDTDHDGGGLPDREMSQREFRRKARILGWLVHRRRGLTILASRGWIFGDSDWTPRTIGPVAGLDYHTRYLDPAYPPAMMTPWTKKVHNGATLVLYPRGVTPGDLNGGTILEMEELDE